MLAIERLAIQWIGTKAVVRWHDDAARCVEARTFRAWLEAYADELEHGHYGYSDDYGGLMHQDDLYGS